MWEKIKGYKTYAIATIAILYGVIVDGLHNNDWNAAGDKILFALSVAGLRNALPTK